MVSDEKTFFFFIMQLHLYSRIQQTWMHYKVFLYLKAMKNTNVQALLLKIFTKRRRLKLSTVIRTFIPRNNADFSFKYLRNKLLSCLDFFHKKSVNICVFKFDIIEKLTAYNEPKCIVIHIE